MKKKIITGILTVATVLALTACGNKSAYKDGEYKATTKGHNADLTVSVKVEKGKIADVKVTEHKETDGIFDSVEEKLIPEIVKNQGTEKAEAISGATVSSNAVKEAVSKALKDAK
ncbi:FMN-binding protein [Clostridium tetani]|nr:FMN-binding protein [Clostridium tetani]QBD87427.1 FMN-binding protein [Clostridium tetani]